MQLGKKIRIKISSYDPGLVDRSMQMIISVLKKLKTPISGPIPLPTEREIYTVKKSPHVYKKSNEQFQLCTHKRFLDIYTDSNKTIEELSKISLPSCINIVIKQ